MLSIFTIPKPFVGHNNIIQRNAIKSWLQLEPKCEIVLFGDDAGVADTALELGVEHIPFVEKNEFGTPLLDSAFNTAQEVAKHDILVYANSDIIFFQELIEAVNKINIPRFLLSGQRWDFDIHHEIDFSNDTWVAELLQRVYAEGRLHGPSGVDYFIFKRHSVEMPPFAVGRPGWDGWLIYSMRTRGIPVIDSTAIITAIHQNHDYSHSEFGKKKKIIGPEREMNTKLAGGAINMMSLREANLIMNEDGIKPPDFPRRIFPILSSILPWRILLSIRRNILVVIDSLK